MDRGIWTKKLTESACPPWPCPMCGRGCVSLVAGSMTYEETAPTRWAAQSSEWDHEWTEYTFLAQGRCTNPDCRQIFAISGDGGIDQYYDHVAREPVWEDAFRPRTCFPVPEMFALSDAVPNDVRWALEDAFAVFWQSRASCASRMRVAVERLMDYVGIVRRRVNRRGETYDLSLHGRIELYSRMNEPIAGNLLALKWLGNTGSHDEDVSVDDLLDGLEVMEHALAEVVDRRSDRIAAVAEGLRQRHAR